MLFLLIFGVAARENKNHAPGGGVRGLIVIVVDLKYAFNGDHAIDLYACIGYVVVNKGGQFTDYLHRVNGISCSLRKIGSACGIVELDFPDIFAVTVKTDQKVICVVSGQMTEDADAFSVVLTV